MSIIYYVYIRNEKLKNTMRVIIYNKSIPTVLYSINYIILHTSAIQNEIMKIN